MSSLSLLLISTAVIRSQAAIASSNYGTIYNGIGAVPSVLNRTALAPMKHRVLVALLLSRIPPKFWEVVYEIVMIVGFWAVLLTAQASYGTEAALILAGLVPLTFRYDYWDWIPELGASLAATTGKFELCACWFAAAAASKETAPLMPLIFLCYGGSFRSTLHLSVLIGLVMWSVTGWQGHRPMYVERLQVARNGREFHDWFRSLGKPALLRLDYSSTVLLSLSGLVCCVSLGFPLALPWLLFLGAGWIFALAIETRVFTPLLVPIVLALAKL